MSGELHRGPERIRGCLGDIVCDPESEDFRLTRSSVAGEVEGSSTGILRAHFRNE